MDALERKAGNEDNCSSYMDGQDSAVVGVGGFDEDVLLEWLEGLSRVADSTRTYRWKVYAVSVDMVTVQLERVQMLV